jgi:hypothetical protein
MIVLVGKGWAFDDPVMAYTLMNDSNHTSPMHATTRGVDRLTRMPSAGTMCANCHPRVRATLRACREGDKQGR